MDGPSLTPSVRKLFNRTKSNFIRIETNILGHFCAILKKIRQIVLELKFLKELNFGEEELRLHTEKLKISPVSTQKSGINMIHKGHSSGHFCKMTKESEC